MIGFGRSDPFRWWNPPYGPKAIGEFANANPPAAIANAVADAVGARLFALPITAERVLQALEQ